MSPRTELTWRYLFHLVSFRCHGKYFGNHCPHQASHDHVIDEQLPRCSSPDGHRLPGLDLDYQHSTKSLLQEHIGLRHHPDDLSTHCRLLFEFERLADSDIHCGALGGDHLSSAKPHVVHGASREKDYSQRSLCLDDLYITVSLRNETRGHQRANEPLRLSRLYHSDTGRANGFGQQYIVSSDLFQLRHVCIDACDWIVEKAADESVEHEIRSFTPRLFALLQLSRVEEP